MTVAPLAHAETVTLAEGDILIGNPNGLALGGISEIIEACGGSGEANGIDGLAFDVPAEALLRPATLVTSGGLGIDADVYWYDSACGLLEEYDMANLGEANESGIVPADAAYGVVDLIIGAAVNVKLTYESA